MVDPLKLIILLGKFHIHKAKITSISPSFVKNLIYFTTHLHNVGKALHITNTIFFYIMLYLHYVYLLHVSPIFFVSYV